MHIVLSCTGMHRSVHVQSSLNLLCGRHIDLFDRQVFFEFLCDYFWSTEKSVEM